MQIELMNTLKHWNVSHVYTHTHTYIHTYAYMHALINLTNLPLIK